ncbi:hypothetical protein [Acinetobacter towneri]|uniref:hypothetical protein n=1 Tax=Acinetobacter towneri TaxID=202956 RepID=UPI003988AE27
MRRNLELENWLIETTGEEMMANHLGPNWNRFNEDIGFYPNMTMTVADQVWQHLQEIINEQQLRIDALSLALDQIAYPIPHMQKEADLNGCELNGYWAVKMSEDHTYSKDIARKALEKEQALKGDQWQISIGVKTS